MEELDAKEEKMAHAHPEYSVERLIWIESWDELNGASATVEAIWDSDGLLIGLGMILHRKRSFAGKTYDQVMGSDRETCRISTRPWITGMIAHMDQAGTGIRGLTVLGCDNYSHTALGDIDSSLHREEEQLVTDLLPHEILLWNQDQAEGAALRAVSIYAPKAESSNERIIRGLRANFARGHSTRKRLVGDFEFGQWGAPLDLWPEQDLMTLKIDGSEGESISQVAIAPATDPKAIKITTNLGKTITAGNYLGDDWSVFDVATDQELGGLCLAFEPMSHSVRPGAMSSVLAIVRNV
ncbi:hypothetical protein ACHAPI_010348 [Fusarium lateritium]